MLITTSISDSSQAMSCRRQSRTRQRLSLFHQCKHPPASVHCLSRREFIGSADRHMQVIHGRLCCPFQVRNIEHMGFWINDQLKISPSKSSSHQFSQDSPYDFLMDNQYDRYVRPENFRTEGNHWSGTYGIDGYHTIRNEESGNPFRSSVPGFRIPGLILMIFKILVKW